MISVVICTHNGKSRLSHCFTSLSEQRNAPEFEVLLIDNASDDGTGEWAKIELSSYFAGISWRVIKEGRAGLVYARLAGLYSARYPWILFCDDDNVLFPDFLQKAQEVLNSEENLGVLGSLGIPEFLGPKPDWFDQYSSTFAVGPQTVGQPNQSKLVHVYGACSIYRKEPLIKLFNQGFSPALNGRKGNEMTAGDDVEWCWLMQLLGFRLGYDPNLKFTHRIEAQRLHWDYYIKLKVGIANGGAILFSYRVFYEKGIYSTFLFNFIYLKTFLKSILLLVKYSLLSKLNKNKYILIKKVSFARFNSMLSFYEDSLIHFKQLRVYFSKI